MKKFEFRDFALVRDWRKTTRPEKAHVFVTVGERKRARGPILHRASFSIYNDDEYGSDLLRIICDYGDGVSERDALSSIGRMVRDREDYWSRMSRGELSERALPENRRTGEPTLALFGAPRGLTLFNHDEVGELLLSLAKDL